MNITLKNNKLLFINSILFCLSFVLFLIFLLYPNVLVAEDSTKMGLLIFSGYHFLAIFSSFESVVSIFIWLGISILPLALFLISFVYLIKNLLLLLKKNETIQFSKLLFYQISYVVSVLSFLLVDLLVFKRTDDGNVYRVFNGQLSLYFLIPILIFAIYHLVSTIIFYQKNKKMAKSEL